MTGRVFFLLAALSAAAFPALAATPSPAPSSTPAATASPSPSASAPAGNPANGKMVFGDNCATCHGSNAEGGFGPNIRGLGVAIITYTVRNPSSQMGKIPISDQQLADVAAYVSSLTP